jgi:hypothetical protein
MAAKVLPLDSLGSYRKTDGNPKPIGQSGGADIIVLSENQVPGQYDPNTNTTMIEHDDGAVVIQFGPPAPEPRESEDFYENIAEHLSEAELSIIAEKLLMGIEQDIQSRSAWMENMAAGISLLALELKNTAGAAADSSTPAEGVSTIDSPLLLEATIRFQANAMAELLPPG